MDNEKLIKSFEYFFPLKLQKPLGKTGEIQKDELTIKYLLTKDASEKNVLDFLILDMNSFPPIHKRINTKGEIKDLENFQFSIIYESPEDRVLQEYKMKEINQRTVNIIIKKGLARKDEDWLQKYL